MIANIVKTVLIITLICCCIDLTAIIVTILIDKITDLF